MDLYDSPGIAMEQHIELHDGREFHPMVIGRPSPVIFDQESCDESVFNARVTRYSINARSGILALKTQGYFNTFYIFCTVIWK